MFAPQGYNGVLQTLPAIIIAFFAGPLSDKYNRKPLLLFSLVGFILRETIFLLNSIWFYELKVGEIPALEIINNIHFAGRVSSV